MGRIKSKEVKVYAPAGFKATWQKYLEICDRDGTNASREIRKFVAGEVARRAPGNPQRTLAAYVEGHPDAIAASWSTTLKELIAYAEGHGGELRHLDVITALRAQGLEGTMLVARAGSMEDALRAVGVIIVYSTGPF